MDRFQFSLVTQLCLTLCDPMDCSKPGLPVHHQLPEFTQTHVHWVGDGLQTTKMILDILCCAGLSRFSCVQLFVTPWTVAHQAPLTMEIFQERILEWVVIPSSRGSSQPRVGTQVFCFAGGSFPVWANREAQGYWSGYPNPSPGELPDLGVELGSPALQEDSLPAEISREAPWMFWNDAIQERKLPKNKCHIQSKSKYQKFLSNRFNKIK